MTATPFHPESNECICFCKQIHLFIVFLYFPFLVGILYLSGIFFYLLQLQLPSTLNPRICFCIIVFFAFSFLMGILYLSGNHLCLLQLRLCSAPDPIWQKGSHSNDRISEPGGKPSFTNSNPLHLINYRQLACKIKTLSRNFAYARKWVCQHISRILELW